LEPFPRRKIAKSRPDTPHNSKIPKCDLLAEPDVARVTTTINGSDAVINAITCRPEVNVIASVLDCGSSLGFSNEGIKFSQQLVTLDSFCGPETPNHVECADRPLQGFEQLFPHGIVPLSG
jgi:hypothetical protein